VAMRRIARSNSDCPAPGGCSARSEPPPRPESATSGHFPIPPERLRYPDGKPRSERLARGNLDLRPDEFDASVDGQRVGLTIREFQLLYVLAECEDRVVRRTEIYRRVWGGEMKYRERAVDVFVRKLRNKLAAAAPGWLYIHTHVGVGYRFSPEPLDPGIKLS
jgi:DNA-binding response OmpR family regulator